MPRKSPDKDFLAKTFGRLTVVCRDKLGVHGGPYYKCRCQCGNETTVRGYHLRTAKVKSCGCLCSETTSKRTFKGTGEIFGWYWTKLKRHASERNIPFNITIEFAWELYQRQNGKCAISGIPLKMNFRRWSRNDADDNTASLDRIDSSKPYEADNVQWVHKHINWMKNKFSQQYFIEVCREVTMFQNEARNGAA